MGKSSQKEKRLAGRVSLALAAGMFSVVPVVHAMPTADLAANAADRRSDGLGGLTTTTKTMNVIAEQTNTVAHWKDFSIQHDETVHFEDGKNFMNVVTGKATTAIDGAMTGTGNIYLINPNGVIFGATANVNVGNLYVSTRNDVEQMKQNFTGLKADGTEAEGGILAANAVFSSSSTPLVSDIVNLTDGDGHLVQANTVVMEGRNIRFLNVVNTTATGTIPTTPETDDGITGRVTLRSNYNASYANKDYTDGYIHIGHRDTDVAAVSDAVTDAYTKYAYGYVNNEAARTQDENKGVVDYTLVYSAKSDGDGKLLLTDIATQGFDKNYMLAENIDASSATGCNMTAPIGNSTTPFSGKFDGMFKTVNNLTITESGSNYIGLFGYTNGARIENVGVEDVLLKGEYAGGIVGSAYDTDLINTWNGSGIVGTSILDTVGGLVGYADHSRITSSYNAAAVKGGGIAGKANYGSITNSYNIGNVSVRSNKISGIVLNNNNLQTELRNVYSASSAYYSYADGVKEVISFNGNATPVVASHQYTITTSDPNTWTFDSVSTEGGSGKTWRLYQGTDQLPLLTAFFKGTVSTEYSYNADANTTRTSTVGTGGTYNTTADGKTLPNKTYDATSVYLSYEQNAAGKFVLDNGNYRYATTEELADTTITKYQGKSDLHTTYYGMNTDGAGILQNDRKDVYTGAGTTAQSFALFYGNQQGYDLYGNNFTLNKRALTVSVTPGAISKTYDGEATKSVDLETSAAVDAIDGLIPGDTVGVKGSLTYTYYDSETGGTANANAGNKWISIVGSNDVGTTGDGGNNYSVDLDIPTSRMEGEIYKRKIMVSLKTAEGIDKTYDGTSDVTNESGTGLDHALNNYTNIQYEVDTTGLSGDTPEEIAAKRDMLVNQNFDSGGIVIKNSVLAKYIGNNGTTPAIHVADTSDDSYAHVAYTGIELNTPSDNFMLVDEANPNQELTSESFLYGKGKITPRKLSTKELSVGGDDPVSKTYDGTTTTTVGTGSSIGFVSGSIRTTKSNAQSDHTGILNYTYKDENNNDIVVNDNVLTFIPDGTATFFYKDEGGNLHETADATASGNTGATIAKYGATVGMSTSTPKASVWTDYVWNNGDELSNGAEILAGGADNSGHIDKRTVNVALVKNANIDKVYDGDENVKTNAAGGIVYHATPASGATGNLKYADGYVVTPVNSTDASVLVNDNTSISITQATYNDKNVAYETDGVTPKAKNITYTLKVSGDAAKNYIINGDDSVASGDTLTLNASGKITPKALTVTATQTAMDVSKTYDGTSDVEPSDVNTTNLSVTGWASGDNAADLFKIGEVSASYGEGTTDAAFEASANVAYTGSSVTSKDVQYIGLQGALKSKNYTISNTAYGKGIIYKATINKANLVDATSVNNNTLAAKVYDGTTNYDDSGIIASSTKAKQYLTLDYGALETSGIHLTDADKEKLVYTIADAVYNAGQTKDVGTKNMTLTFNFVKSGNANFDLVNDSDQVIDLISLEKTGYQSDVTKRTVTATLSNQPTLTKYYDATGALKKADGTTYNASDIKGWFTLTGIVSGETDDVGLDEGTLGGAYVDYNASPTKNSKTINYTGLQLLGTDENPASNYTLVLKKNGQTVTQITGVGTINQRTVQLSDYGFVERDYEQDNANVTTNDIAITVGNNRQVGETTYGETDWTVLARDGISADGASETGTGIITPGTITGEYLKTGIETLAEDVRRKSATDRTVKEKDVQYSGVYNVFNSTNYIVKDKNGNVITNDTQKKGTFKATEGGIINPIALTIAGASADDATKVYDGTTAFKNNDDTNAAALVHFATGESEKSKLAITGAYNDKDVADATKVTYTIRMNGSLDNYNLTGNVGEVIEANGAATVEGVGAITKRKIYAYVPTYAQMTNTQKAKVTKTYDGTTDLSDPATVKSWVMTNLAEDGTGAAAIISEGKTTRDDVYIDQDSFSVAFANKNANVGGSGTKVRFGGTDDDNNNLGTFALAGTDAGNYDLQTASLSRWGEIKKRKITAKFANSIDKLYDGDAIVKDQIVDAEIVGGVEVNPATNDKIVATWENATADTGLIAADADDLFVTGTQALYGTWTANGKKFVANSNVNRDKNKNVIARDVLYYNFTLDGDAAGNYELANSQGAKITPENGNITTTEYFQEAKAKGTIRPIAISMDAVKSQWGEFNKVYDGSASVEGLLADGSATPTKYQQLTVYYDKNSNGERDANENVTIPYTVTSASYVNANAGEDIDIEYKGFSFNANNVKLLENGNVEVDGTKLAQTSYADGAEQTLCKGDIARRLLVVTPGTSNTKIYDGNAVLKPEGTAYTVAKRANKNDPTGLVGNDVVSVTYAANFDNATASVDPDASAGDAGWTAKEVTYTFTLADRAGKDFAKNYTLKSENTDTSDVQVTRKTTGAIKRREVYVDFAPDKGKGIDKVYDGDAKATLGDNILVLKDVDEDKKTGILPADQATVKLDGNAKAYYVNAFGNADANVSLKNENDVTGGVTTKMVYVQNLNLEGDEERNYILKVKDSKGNAKSSIENPGTKEQTLVGEGTIKQRKVGNVVVDDVPNRREYDGTDQAGGKGKMVYDAGTQTFKKDHLTLTLAPDGISDTGFMNEADKTAFNLQIESAIYYDPARGVPAENEKGYSNAKDGLGVVYRLKWNNKNYTLDRVAYGDGEIKPRTLTYKAADKLTIDKTYDGTKNITNKDSAAVANGLFSNVVKGDDVELLIKNGSHYEDANTGAAANSKTGRAQSVNLAFTVQNGNYRLSAGVDGRGVIAVENPDDEGYSRTGTYTGTGRINRALVTMSPTEVSYYPSQLATATYTGQVAGFVNGDNRPTVTYGRDGNTSMLVGKYTLLGYVNGKRVPVNGETFADGFENYYFTTKKNSALTILAEPVKPDVPVVPDIPTVLPDMGNKPVTKVVTESVISDTKFTPDEYSYNRMSKDPDTTHVNRVSSATLQYSEKGVNIEGEDSKSGLASLADIQGRGSVVNLNGALIQTSAPAEQPEKVAETAALPISEMDTTEDATSLSLHEKEENDDSSIGLEYADNTGGSQSVLEILTNASSKAENKGTSIVIDTQDEDEEDAEIEKTRRAIFADRSNIGIETLGNAVNLNQMIG